MPEEPKSASNLSRLSGIGFEFAAAVLLPGLGTFGLWEPQERQLADKVAARLRTAPRTHVSTLRDASKFMNRILAHLTGVARERTPRRP